MISPGESMRTEFFPSIKGGVAVRRSFAAFSDGRETEKFKPVAAKNRAFCQQCQRL
jgi:hypothetical protein